MGNIKKFSLPTLLFFSCVFFPSLAFAMPPPVVAAVASGVVAGATAFFTVSGATLATALVYGAGTAAVTYFTSKQAAKQASGPGAPSNSSAFSSQARERMSMVRQPITNRRIIYGLSKVSGPILFINTSGSSNEFLHLVIAIAGHEVDGYETFYVNDKEVTLDSDPTLGIATVTDTDYANDVKIRAYLGTDEQEANATLLSAFPSQWTTDHKLSGIAYLYVRVEFNANDFSGGIPQIRCLVRGKKVFDPRDNSSMFTNNSALVIRDYLTDERYGLAVSTTELDDDSFKTSANLCDEHFTLYGYGDVSDTSGDKGFPVDNISNLLNTSNNLIYPNTAVVFTFANSIISYDNTNEELFTGDGVMFITGSGDALPTGITAETKYFAISVNDGKLKLAETLENARNNVFIQLSGSISGTPKLFKSHEIKYTANGTIDTGEPPKNVIEKLIVSFGADLSYSGGKFIVIPPIFSEPTITFDEDDLTSGLQVAPKTSRRDRFNAVKGVISDPKNDWQTTDYPPVISSSYGAEDGETIFADVAFEMTISRSMARRLAKLILYDARHEMLVNVTLKTTGLQVKVGDFVSLSNERFGFQRYEVALAVSNTNQRTGNTYVSKILTIPDHKFNCFDVVQVEGRGNHPSVWGEQFAKETSGYSGNDINIDNHYLIITNQISQTGGVWDEQNENTVWDDDDVVLININRVILNSEGKIDLILSEAPNFDQASTLFTGNEKIVRPAKQFRVIEHKIVASGSADAIYYGTELALKETSYNIYDPFSERIILEQYPFLSARGNYLSDVDPIQKTALFNPLDSRTKPSITTFSGNSMLHNISSTVIKGGILVVITPTKYFTDQLYEIQWKFSSESTNAYRISFVDADAGFTEIKPFDDNDVVDIRVRSINSLGVASEFATTQVTVEGLSDKPEFAESAKGPVSAYDLNFSLSLEYWDKVNHPNLQFWKATIDETALAIDVDLSDGDYRTFQSGFQGFAVNYKYISSFSFPASLTGGYYQSAPFGWLVPKLNDYSGRSWFSPDVVQNVPISEDMVGRYRTEWGLVDSSGSTSSTIKSQVIDLPSPHWNQVSFRRDYKGELNSNQTPPASGVNSLDHDMSLTNGFVDNNFHFEQTSSDREWDNLPSTWDACDKFWKDIAGQTTAGADASDRLILQGAGFLGSSNDEIDLDYDTASFSLDVEITGTDIGTLAGGFRSALTGATISAGGTVNAFGSTVTAGRAETMIVSSGADDNGFQRHAYITNIRETVTETYYTETFSNINIATYTANNFTKSSTGIFNKAPVFNSSLMTADQGITFHRVEVTTTGTVGTTPLGFQIIGSINSKFVNSGTFINGVDSVRIAIISTVNSQGNLSYYDDTVTVTLKYSLRA